MPWLLLLHIVSLLTWSGTLLYLPALAVGLARRGPGREQHSLLVARRLFTLLVTPAASISIMSGTALWKGDTV